MDRRQVINRLFPDHLRFNEDYRVWIDALSNELGIVADYIEMFSNLSSISKTPAEFVQDLATLVGYAYRDSDDDGLQRSYQEDILCL